MDLHLTRLQNAIEDFQKTNPALFPDAPNNQVITDLLNDKVPLNGPHQRVSSLFLPLYRYLRAPSRFGY